MLDDMTSAASRGVLPAALKAEKVVLDQVVLELVAKLISGDETAAKSVANLISHSSKSLCPHSGEVGGANQ